MEVIETNDWGSIYYLHGGELCYVTLTGGTIHYLDYPPANIREQFYSEGVTYDISVLFLKRLS